MNHDELMAEGRMHAVLGDTSILREKRQFARGYAYGVEAALEDPAKYGGAGAGGNDAARRQAGVPVSADVSTRQDPASIDQPDRVAIYGQYGNPKGSGSETAGKPIEIAMVRTRGFDAEMEKLAQTNATLKRRGETR